ncbi:MAG TPA: CAP domain-containing protein [Pyrinomonadaceae bacterium]|nr:CAP domain-containing protein [Pyrinomonadaceae bacterium]
MKRNITILILGIILFAANASAQNLCTKQTSDETVKIYVRNATGKGITVNYVDENCKENGSGEVIEPGRAFTGETSPGHAFRVREEGTKNLLKEVAAEANDATFTVGNVKYSDPKTGFIETLNRVRAGRNLPPMEYNDSLNKACQWFADLMAQNGKSGHDAVEIGGNSYANMQDPSMRIQKYGYIGNGGTEATAEGDWEDISMLGADSMLGWSSSNTHYRPFLGMDGQMFKQVGFGYAKSAKKPGYYYTCAVFGNPVEKSAVVKSEKPDGLKFTALKFFTGTDNYGTSFTSSSVEELKGEFAFENPSSKAFSVSVHKFRDGQFIGSDDFKDMEGSGAMEFTIAGEAGKTGKVLPGKYRVEVHLGDEILISSEAVVR